MEGTRTRNSRRCNPLGADGHGGAERSSNGSPTHPLAEGEGPGLGSGATRYPSREMARRGRIGAYMLHARHDPRETSAPGRAAFLSSFERDVRARAEGERTEPDRGGDRPSRCVPGGSCRSVSGRCARRSDELRKAHFSRLAHRRWRNRRRSRCGRPFASESGRRPSGRAVQRLDAGRARPRSRCCRRSKRHSRRASFRRRAVIAAAPKPPTSTAPGVTSRSIPRSGIRTGMRRPGLVRCRARRQPGFHPSWTTPPIGRRYGDRTHAPGRLHGRL
jgi:hypothetical protein